DMRSASTKWGPRHEPPGRSRGEYRSAQHGGHPVSSSPPSPGRLPTLTEVVGHDEGAAAPATPAATTEQELTQRVLANVQRQIDLMLEPRLREAPAPALAPLTDALLREVRGELASALRDIVSRAVAQELSRHRER